MLDQRLRIGFVSNSREVGDALKRSANPDTDDIIVQTASMEDAVPVARQLLRNGVEVILGGGGTGSLLAQTLGQPVVKIGRSSLDVLKALAAAREHGVASIEANGSKDAVETLKKLRADMQVRRDG